MLSVKGIFCLSFLNLNNLFVAHISLHLLLKRLVTILNLPPDYSKFPSIRNNLSNIIIALLSVKGIFCLLFLNLNNIFVVLCFTSEACGNYIILATKIIRNFHPFEIIYIITALFSVKGIFYSSFLNLNNLFITLLLKHLVTILNLPPRLFEIVYPYYRLIFEIITIE